MSDAVMYSEEIKRHIPHRHPFLFVDVVTDLKPGERAEGFKLVTHNEWFFPGHFPDRPILPGVLSVEALAQLAGICFSGGEGGLGVLTGLDGLKFRRQVRPGERLDLQVELDRRRGPFVRVRARASVDGETAVEGVISFSLVTEDG
ncbi:MAG: 3-hydroxyacyl-ACP dehydratase FabZ [Bacillota bacterium]|jgi:3-hydroxyacyl-[acyl-carrier-protein] dehydratase